MHAYVWLYRRCRWSFLLRIWIYAESSLNVLPFSLESGNFLTHFHNITGMFNRGLSHIVVASFKRAGSCCMNATKCVFNLFNEHIKGRQHVLRVVVNHPSIRIPQLNGSPTFHTFREHYPGLLRSVHQEKPLELLPACQGFLWL